MNKSSLMLIIVMIILLSISYVSAVCTLTLDKETYSLGETPEVIANCDENPAEKNQDYTINWTNSSGFQVHIDTGTTPAVAGTNFFETFEINSTYISTYGTTLNVNMTGTNLEGTDTATVQTAQEQDIIISGIDISSQVLINRAVGVHADIKDENEKKLSNAQCNLEVFDGNNIPTIVTEVTNSINGAWGVSTQNLNPAFFKEDTQFSLIVHCFCGTLTNVCIDEDGTEVNNSIGSASFPFTIGTWLNVNTVVDRESYNLGEEIFISTNVTNVEFDKRIALKIFHQLRCSAGEDNNEDRDRALLVSDDNLPDIRGIGVNTTQMQSKRFIIPEPKYLQGRESECYASTETWVVNEENVPIFGYTTTSTAFNITSDTVQIDPTWEKIGGAKFNAIINMSESLYREFNATETSGNFDVRLAKVEESIAHEGQQMYNELDISRFRELENIKSITVRNLSSLLNEGTDYNLELTRTGHIEIEVRNQDITPNGWINVTVELHNFEERQSDALENHSLSLGRAADALEGIENKTGTFQLNVDCPAQAIIGDEIGCTVQARVEDSQLVQKEVDFTCYILKDGIRYSEINFNKMITRELTSLEKSFLIPVTFEVNESATLQCHADYYNFGSRRDSFFDTFTVYAANSGDKAKVEEVLEESEEKKSKIGFYLRVLMWGLSFVIFVFIILMFVFVFKKKKKDLNIC